MYRFIASRFSPAGKNARLSILIYHRVLPTRDPLFPIETTADSFDLQLTWLKSVFNVLPLPDAILRLRSGTLPARAACITFDDGYADNFTQALPILRRHGLHATFFIATAYLNGGRMFNDTVTEAIRRSPLSQLDLSNIGLVDIGCVDISTDAAKAQAINQILPKVKYLPTVERDSAVNSIAGLAHSGNLPTDFMMTTSQLKELHAAGMEIGGHTSKHPILAKLDDESARTEIRTGLDFLKQALGADIRLFAYPNGKANIDYLPAQTSLLRELGIHAAVATDWGAANQQSDLLRLPRFSPWARTRGAFLRQMIGNLAR